MLSRRPFEYTLFAIIVFNCGVMAIECPAVRAESPLGQFLHWSNAACTGIFTVEMCIKVFAWGFVPYIKQITNQVRVSARLSVLCLAVWDGRVTAERQRGGAGRMGRGMRSAQLRAKRLPCGGWGHARSGRQGCLGADGRGASSGGQSAEQCVG